MAIPDTKLKQLLEEATKYEEWHETDDIDAGPAFAYALKAADHVKRLVKEVERLREFEWKYKDLQQ
jgi:hypothetical protein